MPNEDLIIRIKQEIENKGLQGLKDMLDSTAKEMDKLASSGNRGSKVYDELKQKAVLVATALNTLRNEYKGIEAESKKTAQQQMKDAERVAKSEVDYANYSKRERQRVEKEVADSKRIANQQAINDIEMQRRVLDRQLSQQYDRNKYDSQFTGQSTTLGSRDAIKQQITYYKEFRDTLSSSDPRLTSTNQKIKELEKAHRDLGGQVKASKFQMMEWGENLTVVAAGVWAVTSRIVQLGGEMLKLGGNLLTVQTAFERFSGGADLARQNLELLRTASSGNMTDEAIMKFANRYLALGYNINQVAQILDFAERNADDFGSTMDESMQRVLRYFESGKTKGFEQLAVDAKKLEQETYRLAGGTKELFNALDEETQQTIRTNAFLNIYGETLGNIQTKQKGLDDKVANTTVTIDNAQAKIGIYIAQGLEPMLNIYGKLDEVITKVSGGLTGMGDVVGILLSPVTSLWTMLGKIWDMMTNLTSKSDEFKSSLLAIAGVVGMAPGLGLFSAIAAAIDFVNEKIRGMLGLLNKVPGVDIDIPNKEAMSGTSTYKEAKGGTLSKEGKSGRGGNDNEEVLTIQKIIEQINIEIENLKLKGTLTAEIFDIKISELEAHKNLVKSMADENDYLKANNDLVRERSALILGRPVNQNAGILPDTSGTPSPYTQTSGTPAFQQKGISELFFGNRAFALLLMSQTNEIFGSIKTSISGLMQSLNIGTDTFVGKMLSGFDRAVSYIDTIVAILQTANSVSSIIGSITSIVTGGIMGGSSGGGGIIGRSTNLSGMVSGMVGRGLAGPAGSPNIAVVVESEVEKTKAVKFYDGTLNDYYKYRRKSTFGNTR